MDKLKRSDVASGSKFPKLSLTLERVTVTSSDLFKHDNYIKSYLRDPEIPLITKVKIGLRYYITPELIIQLDNFKSYLKVDSFATRKVRRKLV